MKSGSTRLLTLTILLLVAGLCITAITSSDDTSAIDQQTPSQPGAETPGALNPELLALKPNTWVKLHQPDSLDWRRQRHSGLAYDSKRGTLLIFGSDTHGNNWDNSVHEFNPVTLRWTTHYPPAPRETYRADEQGHAIAGTDRLLPWAMHTYDTIVYDAKLDALLVSAVPEHNPAGKHVPEAKIHPTWLYDLKTHRWTIFPNRGKPYPSFFAGASAYDEARDVITVYKRGIWELGPKRDEWKRVGNGSGQHKIHYSMVYDNKHRNLAVFGDYSNSNAVWIYTPGDPGTQKGHWVKKQPEGDFCTPDQTFPVAFDSENGLFLLITRNKNRSVDKKGREHWGKAKSSSTFIYNPETNRYHKLPDADMDTFRMNYMMAYDRFHKVFLLVTGDWRKPPVVWALRLVPDKLTK